MAYGSEGVSKQEYGAYLTASLGYLMNRQHDGVGLMLFADRIVTHLPVSTRPGHLRRILLALNHLKPSHKSNLSKPLSRLADVLSRRGMIVLISDLLDDPEQVIKGLRHLRCRGTDVIVFHVLDHAELTFPFDRPTKFQDLETDDEIMTVPSLVREHYLEEVGNLIARYKRELRLAGIDYCLVDTSKPLDFALLSYLGKRGRLY